VLNDNKYALGLSPGFFRFYALTGVLHALEEKGCLHATHVSGASAGALVGGFYASGMAPSEMIKSLFAIERSDVWDMGGIGGLLQGKLFHEILERVLPVKKIEECKIPYGATAYDLLRFRTTLLHDGCLPTAIRASCTFPGLFQPVFIDNSPHIDGGVFDDIGLMALPGVPSSGLVVNVVCGELWRVASNMPAHCKGAQVMR
jgi:NTE family protein